MMTRRPPHPSKSGRSWIVEGAVGGLIEVSSQEEAEALERYIQKRLEQPSVTDEVTKVARPPRKR